MLIQLRAASAQPADATADSTTDPKDTSAGMPSDSGAVQEPNGAGTAS
jgi:hypothetical protein